jgi:chromosome segregation ATPase
MNFLKQTWLVIFGLLGLIILFFTKCSDSKHLQKEIRDETIFLNQHISKVTKEPSTPQPVIKVVKKSLELEKLISERDTALQLTLKIKEKNQHLQLKELELQEKIKELLKNKNKNNTSIQTKLTASAAALLAANELTNNKNNEIQKLIQERDEATKASLEIEKKFQDLQSNSTQIKKDFQSEIEILQNSIKKDKEIAKNLLDEKQNQIDNLTNKLNHLEENLQDELHNKQSVEDKLEDIKEKDEKKLSQTSTELSELKKIISNKTEEINKLTQDKDKLTEEVNKLTQDKENIEQTLNKNNKKIENLLEEQNKTGISLQTKLAASVAALLAAKELTASKSDEVQKLLQEKDEAIKISLASDEANKECKTKQSTLNQKIEELTTQ